MGLDHDRILYLWENDPCIVIGRYQNPWAECNLKRMEEDSVRLVRRQSGGGISMRAENSFASTSMRTAALMVVIRDRPMSPRVQLKPVAPAGA